MSCAKRGCPDATPGAPDQHLETEGRGSRVLLPHRPAVLRREIEDLLLGGGYEFGIAGASAITPAAFDALQPSLAVTERGLTGPSGLDVLIQVRGHRSGTRLLLVSGGAEGPAAAAAVARLMEASAKGTPSR
jgi:ActR/RegA family two-component response regulator